MTVLKLSKINGLLTLNHHDSLQRTCLKFLYVHLSKNYESGSSSGKVLDYGLDGLGSIPGVRGVEIFLRSFVSGLVLGSTEPPI